MPEVLAIRVGALVNMFAPAAPMAPLPELKVKVPAVDILVAACCVITPLPAAFKVTEDPEIVAFTAIAPLVPACNVNAPEAVMPLDTVILPVTPAVSVKLNIAPVDAPPIATALESVT